MSGNIRNGGVYFVYPNGDIIFNTQTISYGSPVTTNYGGAPSNLSEMTIDKYGSIDINIIDVNSYGFTLRTLVMLNIRVGCIPLATSAATISSVM